MPNNNIMIGNTPMINIFYKFNGKEYKTYAKLEYYSITGSIKDRIAYYILRNAKRDGTLKDGMPIIEASSGNTGIAISALGRFYNHPVYIFMPNWVSKERVSLMKSFGAEVFLVSKDEGGVPTCVKRAKQMADETNGFLPNQFANRNNYLAHYETTGNEILRQISERIGGLVAGVGTGGTLMGTGDRIREFYDDVNIVAVEPANAPILSEGKVYGPHKIEGIGNTFIPEIVNKNKINEIIKVNDDDAINMSRKLAKFLGLGVGISSGANFIGSIIHTDKIKSPVVTVFPDDNKKYLSTELSNNIDNNPEFISNQIELIGYNFVPT